MLRLLTAALAATLFAVAPAPAQDWPTKPVRIIVPFGAGGTGDALARIVAEHLSASLKQQFVVENRTGAGGMIGVQALASSAPDGYTVGITNVSTLSLIPVINPKNAYHPLNDFSHVAFVAGAPVSLAVFPETRRQDAAGVHRLRQQEREAADLRVVRSGLGRPPDRGGDRRLDQDQSRARSLQEHGAGAGRRGRRPCRVLDLHAVVVVVVHPRRHADRHRGHVGRADAGLSRSADLQGARLSRPRLVDLVLDLGAGEAAESDRRRSSTAKSPPRWRSRRCRRACAATAS